MSEFLYANVVRGGTIVVARNIFVQLSPVGTKEAAEYQGSDPNFTYNMYTRSIPVLPVDQTDALQQGDHVVDIQVIDPKTKIYRTFLIISSPQLKALTMTWQWVAVKMRGT